MSEERFAIRAVIIALFLLVCFGLWEGVYSTVVSARRVDEMNKRCVALGGRPVYEFQSNQGFTQHDWVCKGLRGADPTD